MKKYALSLLLVALFVGIILLCACNQTNTPGSETGTDETADESDSGESGSDQADSGGETATGISEAATAIPRYDYFEPDVLQDVTIDQSVYTDLILTLPSSLLITDEDVTAFIGSLLFRYRTADGEKDADGNLPKVTDQPLKLGDTAYIYYRGVLDGEEFEGGSNMDSEEPYALGLGSGSFIPGFEEGLVGVVPNTTTKDNPYALHVTFPEGYSDKLSGRDVVFYVIVEYAEQYTLPEYTRSFVVDTLTYEPKEDYYAGDKALLQEFEASVREELESRNEQNVSYAKIDALWTYLTDHVVCVNKPQIELDFYYDSYVSEIEYYYNYYSSSEAFTDAYPDVGSFAIDYMGMDKDADWQEELHHMADLMVQKDMITHAIAELEGMETVTDEEYQAEIDYWVEAYYGYMTEQEIVASMGDLYLRESAFAQKMSTWLLDRVTFVYDSTDSAE